MKTFSIPVPSREEQAEIVTEFQTLEDKQGSALFFDDLLDANPSSPIGYTATGMREFNPRYAEAEGALLGHLRYLHTDIYGNPPSPVGFLLRSASYGGQDGRTGREFFERLRNRGKFFDHEAKRERDLILNMRN